MISYIVYRWKYTEPNSESGNYVYLIVFLNFNNM